MIDFEVSLFWTAGGLAYLSTSANETVVQIMRDLSRNERWGPKRFGLTERGLLAELAQIRRQGFATRRPGYTRETIGDDGLHAIAVPIHEERPAVGALTICWVRTYMPPHRFAKAHLDRLQSTAQSTTEALRRRPVDR